MDRNIEAMFFSLPPEKRMEIVSKMMDAGGPQGTPPEDEDTVMMGPQFDEPSTPSTKQVQRYANSVDFNDVAPPQQSPQPVLQANAYQNPVSNIDTIPQSSSEGVPFKDDSSVVASVNSIMLSTVLPPQVMKTDGFVLVLGLRRNDVENARLIHDCLRNDTVFNIMDIYLQNDVLVSESASSIGYTEYSSAMQLVSLADKAIETSDGPMPPNVHRINVVLHGQSLDASITPSMLMLLHTFKNAAHYYIQINGDIVTFNYINIDHVLKQQMQDVSLQAGLKAATKTMDTFAAFCNAFGTLAKEVTAVVEGDMTDPTVLDRFQKSLKTFTASMNKIDVKKNIQQSPVYKNFFKFMYNFSDLMKLSFLTENAKDVGGMLLWNQESVRDIAANGIFRQAFMYQLKSEMFKSMDENVVDGFFAFQKQKPELFADTSKPISSMLSVEEVLSAYTDYEKGIDPKSPWKDVLETFLSIHNLAYNDECLALESGQRPHVLMELSEDLNTSRGEYMILSRARDVMEKLGNRSVRSYLNDSFISGGSSLLDSLKVVEEVILQLPNVHIQDRRKLREQLLAFCLSHMYNKYLPYATKVWKDEIEHEYQSQGVEKQLVIDDGEKALLQNPITAVPSLESLSTLHTLLDDKLTKAQEVKQRFGERLIQFLENFGFAKHQSASMEGTLSTLVTNMEQPSLMELNHVPNIVHNEATTNEDIVGALSLFDLPSSVIVVSKKGLFKKQSMTSSPSSEFYTFFTQVKPKYPVPKEMSDAFAKLVKNHKLLIAKGILQEIEQSLQQYGVDEKTDTAYKKNASAMAKAYMDCFENHWESKVGSSIQESRIQVKQVLAEGVEAMKQALGEIDSQVHDSMIPQQILRLLFGTYTFVESELDPAITPEQQQMIIQRYADYITSTKDQLGLKRQELLALVGKFLYEVYSKSDVSKESTMKVDDAKAVNRAVVTIGSDPTLAEFRWIFEIQKSSDELISRFQNSKASLESILSMMEKIYTNVANEEKLMETLRVDTNKYMADVAAKIDTLQRTIASIDLNDKDVSKQFERLVKEVDGIVDSHVEKLKSMSEHEKLVGISAHKYEIQAIFETLSSVVSLSLFDIIEVLKSKHKLYKDTSGSTSTLDDLIVTSLQKLIDNDVVIATKYKNITIEKLQEEAKNNVSLRGVSITREKEQQELEKIRQSNAENVPNFNVFGNTSSIQSLSADNAQKLKEKEEEERKKQSVEKKKLTQIMKEAAVTTGGGLFSTIPKRLQQTLPNYLASLDTIHVVGMHTDDLTLVDNILDHVIGSTDIDKVSRFVILSLLSLVSQQFAKDCTIDILKDTFREKIDLPLIDKDTAVYELSSIYLYQELARNFYTTRFHKLDVEKYTVPYLALVMGPQFEVLHDLLKGIADVDEVFAKLIQHLRQVSSAREVSIHNDGQVLFLDALQKFMKKKKGPLAKKLGGLLKGRISEYLDTKVNKFVNSYGYKNAMTSQFVKDNLYVISTHYVVKDQALKVFQKEMSEALSALKIGDSSKLDASDFDDLELQREVFLVTYNTDEFKKKRELLESANSYTHFINAMQDTANEQLVKDCYKNYLARKELKPYIELLNMVFPTSQFRDTLKELDIGEYDVKTGGGFFKNLIDSFKDKIEDMSEAIRDKLSPMSPSESILLKSNYALKDHIQKILDKAKKDKMVAIKAGDLVIHKDIVPQLYKTILNQNAGAQDLLGSDLKTTVQTLQNPKTVKSLNAKMTDVAKKIIPPKATPAPAPAAQPVAIAPASTSDAPDSSVDVGTSSTGLVTTQDMNTGMNVSRDTVNTASGPDAIPGQLPPVTNYDKNVPLSKGVTNSAEDMSGYARPPPGYPSKDIVDKVKDLPAGLNNQQPGVITVAHASMSPTMTPGYGTMDAPVMGKPVVGSVIPSAPLAPVMATAAAVMGQPVNQPVVVTRELSGDAGPSLGINVSRKIGMEKQVEEYLKELADFATYMQNKGQKWMDDINEAIKRDFHGPGGIETMLSSKGDDVAQKRAKSEVKKFYYKFLGMVSRKSDSYFAFVKSYYLKESKAHIQYILRYLSMYSKLVDPNFVNMHKAGPHAATVAQEAASYTAIEKQFATITTGFDNVNQTFYNNVSGILDRYGGTALNVLDDDNRISMQNWIETIQVDMNKARSKLKSYYRLNYSMADVIFDAQFVTLYIIKALRIGFTYLALFLAVRVFSPMYEEQVFDKKQDPPSLMKFLLIYLGFDLSFNVFILIVLFLLKFLFKSDDNAFMIDGYLFTKYMLDYALSMTTLFAIAAIVSSVITSKKYFKYKYEGMRAIRAFQEMIFYMAIVIFAMPFFMIA